MIDSSDEHYYLKRMQEICKDLDLCPTKVLASSNLMLGPIFRRWMVGEWPEDQFKNALQNLAIFQGEKWKVSVSD